MSNAYDYAFLLKPAEVEARRLKRLEAIEKKLLGDWKPEAKVTEPPQQLPPNPPLCSLPGTACFDVRNRLCAALKEEVRLKQSAAMYSSWWREARNELWELKKKVSGAPEITGPRKEEK